MNESSPYQPPAPQDLSSVPPPMPLPQGVPAAVSVFGILHLVFAAVGVLTGAWGLFVALAGNPFLKAGGGNQEIDRQIQMQEQMQANMGPTAYVGGILTLLVAVPMIIAGIKLVKRRKSGRKWSNIYAFSSLGAKLVNLVLALIFVLPAMQSMSRGIMESTPDLPDSAANMMGGFMAAGAIGSVVISAFYPVLALILLNRKPVKAWFERQPK